MYVGSIASLIITGANSICDIRRQEIFFVPTVAAGAAGAVWTLLNGREPAEFFIALIPGTIMLMLSAFLKGQLGAGDAVCIMALGCWNDIYTVLIILTSAFLAAAVVGGIYLIRGKRNKEFPFVPFLLAGSIIGILL